MPQAAPQPRTARDKILDCAEALFARRGYAGVGLAEVAEAVGLSKSSLFHHFRSKTQLHAAVVARILARIDAAVTAADVPGGGAADRLDRWIDALVDVLAANPTYARLLLRSLFEDDELTGDLPEEQEANAALHRMVASASALLRDGMASGELRPASVAHTLQTLIGATVFHFASGEFGDEMLGRPLLAGSEVRRRKSELKALVRRGLVVVPGPGARSTRSRRNR
jgi:AcrR family transcriptional regulator